MENLILTMLEALNDYNENDLNFTKSEVDKLVKEHLNLNKLECNELGWIVLEENGYLTKEQLGKYFGCEYEDGHFILVIESFEEILDKSKYSYEISIMDNDLDWYGRDCYDADVKHHWDEYNADTLNDIVKYCIEKELEYDGEQMTSENLSVSDSVIYFNDFELEDIITDDDLTDLYDILNGAICEAQEYADRDEVEKKVINSFENEIGEYTREYIKTKKEGGEGKELIIIKLNINLSELKDELKSYYGDYEFEDQYYGNLETIMKDIGYFEFSTPDYRYVYGTIDDDLLNEITQDRLSW